MKLINKALNNDKRSAIQKAIDAEFPDKYVYLLDFDDEYAYFDTYDSGTYREYRIGYSYNDLVATVSGDRESVVRKSEYVVVDETLTKSSLMSILKELITPKGNALPLIKQFQEEQMIAIEPLYITAGDVDLQGDTISLETTEAMVESFNKANEEGILQPCLFHKHRTESFSVVKAWVNPVECQIGESVVSAGQPLAEIQFNSEAAWQLRKEGKFMGLSIGAQGVGVEL